MPKPIAATLIALTLGLVSPILPLLPTAAIAQTPIPFAGNPEAIALMESGYQNMQAGKFTAAIASFEQLVKIARSAKDVTGECLALGGIANSYTLLGQHDRATNYYQQALTIARQYQLRQFEAMVVGDLAQNYGFLGQYEQALALQLQGLQLNRAMNDQKNEVATLTDLGNLYVALGNDRKAEEYFRAGLVIAQSIKSPKFEAILFSNLGSLLRRAGDYEEALAFQQQALDRYRSLNDRVGEMTALLNLGNVATSLTEYSKAFKFYESSLQLARQSKLPALEIRTLLSIALAYGKQENWAKALEHTQQGLAIATKTKNQPLQGLALTGLSEIYLKTGKLSEAEASIQKALPILDTLRSGLNDSDKITLVDSQSQIYRLFQEVLIRQNRYEAALEASERGRARAFIELLASRLRQKSDAEVKALTQAPRIQQIRQIAQAKKATLVEYSLVGDQSLYIWVVKPNGEVVFRSTPLDPSQPLTQLVTQSRGEIGVRGRSNVVPVAAQAVAPKSSEQNKLRQLHQLLIAPIAQDLPADPNQSVIFLPQGALFLVPFAALPDAAGKYLIERHTLTISPSIQTLELTQALAKRPKSQPNVVIVGDPKMPKLDGSQLSSLPGARKEAIAIAKLLKTAPILGEQATKPFVLKQIQSAKIVHFATHGLLDTIQGDIPRAIALAPSGQDNGLLSASEIFNLKLNADLVVLSACDTGRGEITGDGVLGLSRSFVAAGAPSVLVSLWAVDDGSTSELMSEFYRQLPIQPNKAQALRQAMLKLRQQKPDPFHWAAFTLIGET